MMTDTVDTIVLATELTAAWLGNPHTRADADAVPGFLASIHASLTQLASGGQSSEEAAPVSAERIPAVSVRKSLADPNHILSMIDGKPYRALRRHLSTHGLTPETYRERYKLKVDYPMVAPAYSEARRDMAKKIGLGRKPKATAAAEPAPAPAQAPKPRRRKAAAPAE